MNIEEIRDYCLNKKFVSESFPFNETVLVFKLFDKMFLLIDTHEANKISVKCKPDTAVKLREKYIAVEPAYHMNKKHWNSIHLFKDVSAGFIKKQIDNSYNLIYQNLPKKYQEKFTINE
jgi:predicted DNA-binding protein (MmcQ/YjbR family)